VRAIPGASARTFDERHPMVDRCRRCRARETATEPDGLAAVTNDALVDRAPPGATGPRGERWLQDPAPKLPAHERHRGAAVRKVSGRAAERAVVAALHQRQSAHRVIAYGGDDRLGPVWRVRFAAHRDMFASPRNTRLREVGPPAFPGHCERQLREVEEE